MSVFEKAILGELTEWRLGMRMVGWTRNPDHSITLTCDKCIRPFLVYHGDSVPYIKPAPPIEDAPRVKLYVCLPCHAARDGIGGFEPRPMFDAWKAGLAWRRKAKRGKQWPNSTMEIQSNTFGDAGFDIMLRHPETDLDDETTERLEHVATYPTMAVAEAFAKGAEGGAL